MAVVVHGSDGQAWKLSLHWTRRAWRVGLHPDQGRGPPDLTENTATSVADGVEAVLPGHHGSQPAWSAHSEILPQPGGVGPALP